MESVLSSLSQHAPEFLIAISLIVIGLCLWVLRLSVSLNRARKRWKALLEGTSGDTLERLLLEHLHERTLLENRVGADSIRLAELEQKMSESVRRLGLVRYDAFPDVAGSQSFALALCDDRGNGIIMNGVVGRADCRVYCKTIVNGRAERDLSPEEQQAVAEAVRGLQPSTVAS